MDSSAQKVKERLSIVDVVGQYVQLQKAGRNYRARCPFHKERTPSFMLSPERGTYMCFGCGERGDIFSFVEKIEGVDFATALRQLADRAGVELPAFKKRAPQEVEKDDRLREICEEATRFFEGEIQKRHDVLRYVLGRGVHNETIAMWRIGYAPARWEDLSIHLQGRGFSKEDIVDAGLAARSEKKKGEIYDRFRGRIMFPIFDSAGQPIAFSGRFFEKVDGWLQEGEPAKYVNSPETALFKKSRVLYGFNFAKEYIRKADCILLVEGQFDVVLSHQSGLRFAVALSGTALTPEHLSYMGRFSKRLILALDADSAGIRSGLKSTIMALAAGFDVKIPKLTGGKDPADVAAKDPELLKSAIRSSLPAIEFFMEVLRPQARDDRSYKKLVEKEILPLVAAIRSSIDQAHFVMLIAQGLRVPEEAVRAELGKRPAAVEQEDETRDSHQDLAEEISSFEKTTGMLLFHFVSDQSVMAELSKLLGAGRLEEMTRKLKPQQERLRFEFESMAGEEDSVKENLFESLKRSLLDEEIVRTKDALVAAEKNASALEATQLAQTLISLMRRKHDRS